MRYNLRALYPFAYQIIVIEGACPSARNICSRDGHSLDDTLSELYRFQAEEDPEKKLIVITAEDEGHPNGFWTEKDEMSQAYTKYVTGNYLWQIDSDEFYRPEDMRDVIDMLSEDPAITAITFPMKTFWGGLDYFVDGFFLRQFVVHRVFAWKRGYVYNTHRPPTVIDENGKNLRDIKWITASEMAAKGVFLYHYELLFPKQVREKCSYYIGAQWTDSLRNLDQWMRYSYFSLQKPFRVHMVYSSLSWLDRFFGNHPHEVVEMVDAVKRGGYSGVDLRKTDDIEDLLSNRFYNLQRLFLKYLLPIDKALLKMRHAIKSFIRRTPFWPAIQNLRARWAGGLVPIKQGAVSNGLANAWKSPAITNAQSGLTSRELSEMYEGNIIPPFQVLADAVKATGCEDGEIIEVGCATGYYYEVLRHLLGHAINYKGIDYSEAMIAEARKKYPEVLFELGDATLLPFKNASCDILISGNVIVHVPDYVKVISESSRLARKWVIFHKTPVVNSHTRYFKKRAYGIACIQIHFSEKEFIQLCEKNGLLLRKKLTISEGRPTIGTYVFKKISPGNRKDELKTGKTNHGKY